MTDQVDEITTPDYNADPSTWISYYLEKYGNDNAMVDVSELDGLFTALGCCADLIKPSDWQIAIWGSQDDSPQWQSTEEAEHFLQLSTDMHDDVMETINAGELDPLFQYLDVDGEEILIIDEWCFGFISGVNLWPIMTKEDNIILEKYTHQMKQFSGIIDWPQAESLSEEEFSNAQEKVMNDISVLYQYFKEGFELDTILTAPKD